MRSMLEYQFCIHSSYRRLELLTSIDNCFEWFCVYSLMLDLVVSTPWILISQILPFVCNFGKIVNGCLVGWGSSGGELLFIFLTGT
ncbi:hypothetical protein GLYMA_10G052400v4 [Glycine max]|uniref:Uncharacterized protein n=1 Tax=Glycine max TaxID=3847 RepID=A0A0R0I0R7_SOYBN|nr:hypothetical protein GYH30_027035 [Glycine max]KRH32468.1 hypothetical protein GLYMA_10G052400v4 [Glycine max]